MQLQNLKSTVNQNSERRYTRYTKARPLKRITSQKRRQVSSEKVKKEKSGHKPPANSLWVITFLWCSFCLLSSFFSCWSELDRKAIAPRSTFPVTETTWGTDLRPSRHWKTIDTACDYTEERIILCNNIVNSCLCFFSSQDWTVLP